MTPHTQPERDGYDIVKCWNGTRTGTPMQPRQDPRLLLDYSRWTPTQTQAGAGRDFARRTPPARQQA